MKLRSETYYCYRTNSGLSFKAYVVTAQQKDAPRMGLKLTFGSRAAKHGGKAAKEEGP